MHAQLAQMSAAKLEDIIAFASTHKSIATCFLDGSTTIPSSHIAPLVLQLNEVDDESKAKVRCRLNRDIAEAIGKSLSASGIREALAHVTSIVITDESWNFVCSTIIARWTCATKRNMRRGRASLSALGDVECASASAPSAPKPIVASDMVASYGEADLGDMQLVVFRQTELIQSMKAQMKNIIKNRDYYKQRSDTLQHKLNEEIEKCTTLVAHTNFRPGLRRISLYGGYTLALRRSFGNASAGVAAKMVAGAEDNGGFTDPKVVILFEHRAAQAKRSRAHNFFVEADAEKADVPDWFEIVCYRGDATQQQAIDKEKMHVSLISALQGPGQRGDALDFKALSASAHWMHEAGDLQLVKRGTGEETYEICKREFSSISVPTWEVRASMPQAGHISLFWFGLDNGCDNVGMGKRINTAITSSSSVMYAIVWCFHHQTHLVVKSSLLLVEKWELPSDPLPARYWSSLASLAHVWRSVGTHRKIQTKVAELELEPGPYARIPCRPIGGRWNVVTSIEGVVVAARNTLGRVFAAVLGGIKEVRRKANLGDDEQEAFLEKQRNYRQNCVKATGGTTLYLLCMVSSIGRGPISHFAFWMQKRAARHNADVNAARSQDKVLPMAHLSQIINVGPPLIFTPSVFPFQPSFTIE